jgi:hypothetical protein
MAVGRRAAWTRLSRPHTHTLTQIEQHAHSRPPPCACRPANGINALAPLPRIQKRTPTPISFSLHTHRFSQITLRLPIASFHAALELSCFMLGVGFPQTRSLFCYWLRLFAFCFVSQHRRGRCSVTGRAEPSIRGRCLRLTASSFSFSRFCFADGVLWCAYEVAVGRTQGPRTRSLFR